MTGHLVGGLHDREHSQTSKVVWEVKGMNVPLATACSGARAGRASVRGRGRGRSGQLSAAIERSPSPVAKRRKAGVGLRVSITDEHS